MREIEQVLDEHKRVTAGAVNFVHDFQRFGHVAGERFFKEIERAATVAETEHVRNKLRGDGVAAEGHRLVEQREAVAHRAVSGAGDELDGCVLGFHFFFFADIQEMLAEGRDIDAAQVKTLATRENGERDLADFRGRENEFHVRRRFLECFEKRVEGRFRKHVHFVDDVDFVARLGRGVAHAIQNFAHVVDAGMAGGVHLDDVGVPVFGDGLAEFAIVGRACRRARFAVVAFVIERLGDNAGGCRFADAAHAGEHKGMGDAAGIDGVSQRADEGVLADQFVEIAGTVFPCKDAVFEVGGFVIRHRYYLERFTQNRKWHKAVMRRKVACHPKLYCQSTYAKASVDTSSRKLAGAR